MPLTGKYTRSFQALFTEVRHYLELQKKYLAMETAEKVTTLLSTVAIAAVCLVLGSIVLLFASFALAYWLGNIIGCNALGFLSVSVAILFLMLLFYSNREKWIIIPLARFVIGIFKGNDSETLNDEEEEAIP